MCQSQKSDLENLKCRFPQVAPASEELKLQLPPKSEPAPAPRRAGQGTPASPGFTPAPPPAGPPRSERLHLLHSPLRRLPLPAVKGAFPLGGRGRERLIDRSLRALRAWGSCRRWEGKGRQGAGSFAPSITSSALRDRRVRSGPPLQPRHAPSQPGPRWNYEIQAPEDEDERRRGVHYCCSPQGAGSERNKASWVAGRPRRPAYLPSAAAWRE